MDAWPLDAEYGLVMVCLKTLGIQMGNHGESSGVPDLFLTRMAINWA
jgi:hypothetical protein